MAILNIEKSFLTDNRSVLDFLNQTGQGLYIPLYQREYSWDSDNIDQLLEDLTRGIQRIARGEVTDDTKEIRFLGTIITVIESNRDNIYPVDLQAVPSRIEKLIDGQQRISTIALMATVLTKRLIEICHKVKPTNPIYEQVEEICDIWVKQKLINIFSFDLGRGKPKLKPKIIRGEKDFWTRDKSVDEAYTSELSNFLGHFIQAYVDNTILPSLSKDKYGNTLLYNNWRRIDNWLKKTVAVAHEGESDEYVCARDIISHFSQDLLWEFERPELVQIIVDGDNIADKKSDAYILCELVQTLAVCHYLLDRCCFTIIQPTDDDWAFDMFQSLNATGTPLTAIETFKPTIVQTADINHQQFKDSKSDLFFRKIEDFLSEANTAQQKNKRTNDFLTSFFVAYDGRTISTHFSYQRKILNDVYTGNVNLSDKEKFIIRMGNYAEFYQHWLNYDGKDNALFPKLAGYQDADLASMLILFLKSSNHKMAITVLNSMYNYVIENKADSTIDFINCVKVVAAFYFLWRSTYSNSGLDATYRELFKQLSIDKQECSIDIIKAYFREVLVKKEIDTRDKWLQKAVTRLKYGETGNDIVRLALLATAHDTIPDENNAGMIKYGRTDLSDYLNLKKWLSKDLKTIEHIAPQTRNESWASDLYDPQIKSYQTLGNLTLLPQELNSSAGNKGWKEKLLYYQCVTEVDPDKLKSLRDRATQLSITLNEDTLQLLQECSYNSHLSAFLNLSEEFKWDKSFVDRRTSVMLEIVWERISKWLFN